MAFLAPAIPYILAIGSTAAAGASVYSAVQSKKQAGAIEDQAAENARIEAANTAEQERLLRDDAKKRLSLGQAQSAASGVRSTGTSSLYLDALEASSNSEIDWLKKVGASNYSNALASGRIGAMEAMSGFWGNLGSAFQYGSSAATQGYDAYKSYKG